jgi:hypothetical protein
MSPEVQRYLAQSLQLVRQLRRLGESDAVLGMLTHVAGGLDALRAAAVITPSEYEDWMSRTRKAARITTAVTDGTRPVGHGVLYPGRLEGSPASVSPEIHEGATPLRTIEGADEERHFYEGRLQLPLLELHQTHMVLHWKLCPLHDPRLSEAEDIADAASDATGLPETERQDHVQSEILRSKFDVSHHFVVSDDVGTRYQRSYPKNEAGSSDVARFGTVVLTPPLSPAATEVRVAAGAEQFRFRVV